MLKETVSFLAYRTFDVLGTLEIGQVFSVFVLVRTSVCFGTSVNYSWRNNVVPRNATWKFYCEYFLLDYSSVHEEIDFIQSIGFACGFWLEHKRSPEKPRTHY